MSTSASAAKSVSTVFGLSSLSPVLNRLAWSREAFDPAGAWTACYEVFEVPSYGANVVGKVSLHRQPLSDGFSLQIEDCKLMKEYRQNISAEVNCSSDNLATPRNWRFHSQVLDKTGLPISDLALEKSGKFKSGSVELRCGGKCRTRQVNMPLAMDWALFEAVPRLDMRNAGELRFSLLSDFDQIKPDQLLAYRQTVEVELPGSTDEAVSAKTLRLHCWEQFGRGISPTQYWVDDDGRLLAINAGLRGYVRRDPDATERKK
jgi:hypothetical protein